MKKLIFFFVVATLAQSSFAQDDFKNITINKDPRIDKLLDKNSKANEEVYLKTIRNMSGYRLQIINTNDRAKALSVKTQMMTEFPDEKIYLIYQSPYFKIQMGNFIKREDAEGLMNRVKKIYPTGVFVVPSRVEIRPSKDGQLLL